MNRPSLSPPVARGTALLVCLVLAGRANAQDPAPASRSTAPVIAAAAAAAPASAATAETAAAVAPGANTPPAAGTPQTTETEIIATEGATFASKDRIAVFTGDVRVNDARFKLACDKLTVFLNKSASALPTAGAAATPAPSTPAPLASGSNPPPAAGAQAGNSGGIDHAIAEGHVVIVQERAATAGGETKRSVGRGEWANFDNKTGDMLLKGSPSVEQNENTHVALSPGTVMKLSKDNSLTTTGPSRTIIIQRKNSNLPDAGFGAPASGAAPAGKKKGHGTAPAASPAAGPLQG